jgi:hypothetical protein
MTHQYDLIELYSRDFSTDKVHGQLSVVDIMKETVAELVSSIPETLMKENNREELENKLLLFGLELYHEGREHKD